MGEVELQLGLQHSNIVNILGVAMTAKPYLCALEFALYGDLLEILKASKEKDVVVNEWEQTYLLCQLADALGYLKKNRIVHIDLATRNCLIFGKSVLKLADFGLARRYTNGCDCWKMTGSLMLPFRQLPPETFSSVLWDRSSKEPFNPKFNETTDIWAFGTVIWECATYGKTPFYEIKKGLPEVLKQIRGGLRLQFPASFSPRLYELAQRCFAFRPGDRPSFSDVGRELMEQLQPHEAKVRDIGALLNGTLDERLQDLTTAVTLRRQRSGGKKKQQANPKARVSQSLLNARKARERRSQKMKAEKAEVEANAASAAASSGGGGGGGGAAAGSGAVTAGMSRMPRAGDRPWIHSANANGLAILDGCADGVWMMQPCAPPGWYPTDTDGWYNLFVVQKGNVCTHQLRVDSDPKKHTMVAVENDEEYNTKMTEIGPTIEWLSLPHGHWWPVALGAPVTQEDASAAVPPGDGAASIDADEVMRMIMNGEVPPEEDRVMKPKTAGTTNIAAAASSSPAGGAADIREAKRMWHGRAEDNQLTMYKGDSFTIHKEEGDFAWATRNDDGTTAGWVKLKFLTAPATPPPPLPPKPSTKTIFVTGGVEEEIEEALLEEMPGAGRGSNVIKKDS